MDNTYCTSTSIGGAFHVLVSERAGTLPVAGLLGLLPGVFRGLISHGSHGELLVMLRSGCRSHCLLLTNSWYGCHSREGGNLFSSHQRLDPRSGRG